MGDEIDWNATSHTDRILTDEEKTKLASDITVVSDFRQLKLEKEAQKNWDLFYKRNTTKFFKDRHWTRREFEELCCSDFKEHGDKQAKVFFEVGCGVGNFMFPLLEDDGSLFFYACDFSPRAVDFVKANPAYDPHRCKAFQCDITCDRITDNIPEETVNVATLIFVLSAINPEKMVTAVQNIVKTLKPGGCLLFRDYGLYDHAMLRFSKGHKLSDSFYVRQDGTRAYYFSLDKVKSIMLESGLDLGECSYIHRATVNKKEGINVPRIFVQGKFLKPNEPRPLLQAHQRLTAECDANGENVFSKPSLEENVSTTCESHTTNASFLPTCSPHSGILSTDTFSSNSECQESSSNTTSVCSSSLLCPEDDNKTS